MLMLMGGYLMVTLAINYYRFRSIHHDNKELVSHAFDAATFAASILVLIGVMNPPVLVLIGNTEPFLIIGGLAGLLYSLGALVPRSQ